MAVTTVPESGSPPLAPTVRRLLPWAAVFAAVVASGVLAVQVLDSDRTADTNVAPASFYVERGSIAAIDHLAERTARVADASRVAIERGSITALDHAAEQRTSVSEPAELIAERGSITALDHLAEQDGDPASPTP